MTARRFDYNDASLEAQNARAVAIDLIAAWIGADEIPLGKERNQFVKESVVEKVLAMEWRETTYLIVSLSSIGSMLAQAAAQLPLALNELDVDADEFFSEHDEADPIGYLRGIEIEIQRQLRGDDES